MPTTSFSCINFRSNAVIVLCCTIVLCYARMPADVYVVMRDNPMMVTVADFAVLQCCSYTPAKAVRQAAMLRASYRLGSRTC